MLIHLPTVLRAPASAIVGFTTAMVMREIIHGYGDHVRRVADMASGPQADSRFLIHKLSNEFVRRLTTDRPVREIQVFGHSDRVWINRLPNTADEQKVSHDRAVDVAQKLLFDIVTNPAGLFTPIQLRTALQEGTLTVVVVGLGATQPLRPATMAVNPENRRVDVRLMLIQS